MQITRALFTQMCHLFGINTALLGVSDPTQIRIQSVSTAFTPGLDRVLADVPAQGAPLAFTSISVTDDAPPVEFTDITKNERVVEFGTRDLPLYFEGGAGTYPVTIFGTRLVSQDDLTLLATEVLPAPVTVAAAEDGYQVPRISFRFPFNMVR